MHRETKEMLIGSVGIVLFGAAIIAWPPLTVFIEHIFAYLRMAVTFIP
jgi:hypothetical protein